MILWNTSDDFQRPPEVLSSIKKSSIRYIQEQDKCPVCNKPIDNKEKIGLRYQPGDDRYRRQLQGCQSAS